MMNFGDIGKSGSYGYSPSSLSAAVISVFKGLLASRKASLIPRTSSVVSPTVVLVVKNSSENTKNLFWCDALGSSCGTNDLCAY